MGLTLLNVDWFHMNPQPVSVAHSAVTPCRELLQETKSKSVSGPVALWYYTSATGSERFRLGPPRPSETCGTLWELWVDWWAARPLAGYRHTPKFEMKTWERDSWELSNPCTLSLSPISTVLTGHQNWACAYISPLFIGIPSIKEKIYERRPSN